MMDSLNYEGISAEEEAEVDPHIEGSDGSDGSDDSDAGRGVARVTFQ
jgi:hypothetical protein